MYQRGGVAVVVDEAAGRVVTVLPRVHERWQHTTVC
jgi:tRNA(Met) C34 N-acetyltransferase TmcA